VLLFGRHQELVILLSKGSGFLNLQMVGYGFPAAQPKPTVTSPAINAERDEAAFRHMVSRKACSHIVVKNSFTLP
jgi:hypothetical protein